MNYQNTLIPDNAKLSFQVIGSRIHKFENKKKEKIAEGIQILNQATVKYMKQMQPKLPHPQTNLTF